MTRSHVALLSRIVVEMFYRIRAENFGPLAEIVFHCVGDDSYGTGMSTNPFMLSEDRAVAASRGLPGKTLAAIHAARASPMAAPLVSRDLADYQMKPCPKPEQPPSN